MYKHGQELTVAREFIENFLKVNEPNIVLKIDTKFHMHRESILTLKNKPKRNDTSNRLKALHDVVATILYIDDRWFWSGTFDKLPTAHPAFPECVDVKISLHKLGEGV